MMKSSLSLKLISPATFADAVINSKTKLETINTNAESAEAERKLNTSASMKRPKSKQSSNDTKDDIAMLRALSKRDSPVSSDVFDSHGLDMKAVFEDEIEADEKSTTSNNNYFKTKLKPMEQKNQLVSPKSTFIPSTDDTFRREHSSDHPLAMGKGKYEKEIKSGKTPAGVPKSVPKKKLGSIEGSYVTFEKPKEDSQEDHRKVLEALRKKQNEVLLRILEDEKQAEEQRATALRGTTDPESRNNLEKIFAEERKRASERIIRQTKENEAIIKKAIIAAAMQQ